MCDRWVSFKSVYIGQGANLNTEEDRYPLSTYRLVDQDNKRHHHVIRSDPTDSLRANFIYVVHSAESVFIRRFEVVDMYRDDNTILSQKK